MCRVIKYDISDKPEVCILITERQIFTWILKKTTYRYHVSTEILLHVPYRTVQYSTVYLKKIEELPAKYLIKFYFFQY